MTAVIDFEFDIDHPACGAVGVCSKQAGYLNRTTLMEAFEASDIPATLYPRVPSNAVALKRAMKDLCQGDSTLRVEVKGRGTGAVYSIICTDKERIDLEESDGLGVSDAIVSARLETVENTNKEVLKVKPPNLDQSHLLERFKFHREHFKCSEDLSVYMSQQLLRSHEVGAVSRPGQGSGLYFVPKGKGTDLMLQVKEVFESVNNVNSRGGLIDGVKVSLMPMITTSQDVVDILTDSVLDEAEAAIRTLDEELCRQEEENNLGLRALETRLTRIKELSAKVNSFTKACGDAFADLEPQMKELELKTCQAMLKAVD